MRTISRVIDLERLDGVTLAYDYNEALAQLDRGYKTDFVLKSSSDFAQGVAMTPSVLRDGVVKAHMVVNAAYVEPLERADTDDYGIALYLLAHEAAHVQDLKHRDEAFPNVILRPASGDALAGWLWALREGVWEEYAACRAAAFFNPGYVALFEQPFVRALSKADETIADMKLKFEVNDDHERAWRDLTMFCARLGELAAYLIGHMHGANQTLDDAPTARDALKEHWFAPTYARLETALDELWSKRPDWQGLSEFDALSDIVRDLVEAHGIMATPMDDGRIWIDPSKFH